MLLSRFASLRSATLLLALPAALVTACGGNVVVDGVGGGDPTCTADELLCDGVCIVPDSDPANCGECGASCGQGYCEGGQCVSSPDCPPGLSPCGAACVDLLGDPVNCGGCGNVCPPEGGCFNGTCQVSECFCGGLCDVVALDSSIPQTIGGPSSPFGNQVDTLCASGSGPDTVFSFVAAFDGYYTFDTFGSSFDTALQLMTPGCDYLDCNDDIGSGAASSITIALFNGQQILVVVDALSGGGSFQLHIDVNGDPNCSTCNDFITGASQEEPCPGASQQLYEQFVDCICFGACGMPCGAACNGEEVNDECNDCLYAPDGCGKQLDACFEDL